jgi:threonine efflux protein
MNQYDAIFLGMGAYLIATVSPGPATIAIMGVSARLGRKAGLQLALGVICGSFFWGLCAAFGLAALIARFADAFIVVKILCGTYLLCLSFKAFRSAFSGLEKLMPQKAGSGGSLVLQGLAIHLTNPKPVLAWLAILSIGVQADAPIWHSFAMFGGCALLGLTVFFGYALLFSTLRAQVLYAKARKPMECLFGMVFGTAGLKLITDHG